MKIIFFGNHLYGHHALQAMIKAGFVPELVVTNIPRPGEAVWYPSVAELAMCYDIEVVRINVVSGVAAFSERIKKMDADFFVVSSFRNILDENLLSLPKSGAVNLHMAPLPKYRGAHPENWAIINGEKTMGFTVHYLSQEIDSGDIIAQSEVSLLPEDDILSLTFKLAEKGPELLVNVLKDFERMQVKRMPQDESQASYFPPRRSEDGLIDWRKKPFEIYNLVRALVRPYPGAFTYLLKKKMIVWKTKVILTEREGSHPGKIYDISADGILVGTADGRILIREWSWEGESPVGDLKGLTFEVKQ